MADVKVLSTILPLPPGSVRALFGRYAAPVSVAGTTAATGLSAREDTRLDSGWRFKSGEITNAEQPAFDDSAWEAVSLPHNWELEKRNKAANYRGPGWYRRELYSARRKRAAGISCGSKPRGRWRTST